VWRSHGAPVYAAGAHAHEADHDVILCDDPAAPVVFHWVYTVISLAKTFIDGTYHGADAPDGNYTSKNSCTDLIGAT